MFFIRFYVANVPSISRTKIIFSLFRYMRVHAPAHPWTMDDTVFFPGFACAFLFIVFSIAFR